ncbi:hypothetical protein Tco_0720602 [Tanacetum coccineum]
MKDNVWNEKISSDEASSLEKIFSEAEVWEAIQSCSGDKAPGPDGLHQFYIIRKGKTNMERMGFGEKCRKWVEICLISSMSILVNGSLTEEFGLAIVNEAVSKGVFKGVKVA